MLNAVDKADAGLPSAVPQPRTWIGLGFGASSARTLENNCSTQLFWNPSWNDLAARSLVGGQRSDSTTMTGGCGWLHMA